ncbi:hypothetical protein RMCBS344292_12121 [Rhizopus microsporus]|nr:hypothetical protein RMCBS344292_12121 [Rhizopus microsporus]
MDLMTDCMEDIKALRTVLNKKFEPARLVVIDYAELSTEFNDIRSFFRQYSRYNQLHKSKEHNLPWG